MVVLRRSARDLPRRAHVHRLDLDDRQRVGRALTKGGRLTKKRDLQGPGARRPQQPVARLPPRRAHRGVLLTALRARPAAAGHPQRDALHGLAEPVLDRRASGRCGPSRPTCPAASATRIPTRSQLEDKLWLFWRGGGVEPDVLLHRGRLQVGARARARRASATRSGRTRSTSATATTRSTGSSPTATRELEEQPALPALRGPASCSRSSGRKLGDAGRRPAAHLQSSTTSTSYSDQRRPRVGPRHRAHRRGPAARRLHAARREPRHLLLRVPQRHAVGQPQDRRGGPGRAVVPLRRRDVRPRGSALSSTCRARSGRWNQVEQWFTPDKAARGRRAS